MAAINWGRHPNDRHFSRNLAWIIAFDAWDYNDPAPLEVLIREGKEIPKELAPIVADIIAGKRPPNKKAAAKLKVPASQRMNMAAAASTVLGLIDILKSNYEPDACDPDAPPRRTIERVADNRGVEPISVYRGLEEKARKVIELAAERFGVSVETIENTLRDFRTKLENYPNV